MKKILLNKNERGQSLFELVVAIGISSLIIVVLVALVASSLQNAAFAKNQTLAGRYAEEAVDWLRSERDTSPATFISNVTAQPFDMPRCFNNLNWTSIGPCGNEDRLSGMFTRQISFKEVNATVGNEVKDIIEADVTVSWSDSKGLHEIINATDFSDWRQR